MSRNIIVSNQTTTRQYLDDAIAEAKHECEEADAELSIIIARGAPISVHEAAERRCSQAALNLQALYDDLDEYKRDLNERVDKLVDNLYK